MPSSALPLPGRLNERTELGVRRELAPEQKNLRPIVLAAAQEAPDPPRQGDTPARPARRPIYLSTSIRAFLAVAQDEFFVRRAMVPRQARLDMPRGAMQPWTERGNIDADRPDAYGSLFGLEADPASGMLVPKIYAGVP